jgi:quercetin dioxygenase-like cupin family protein
MSMYGKPTAGGTFDLQAIDAELRTTKAYAREGHTARSLAREDDLRVVLLAMKASARIAEHRADETAVVHVLSGHVRLHLRDEAVDLPAGRLFVLEPGLPHDVEAVDDSSFLLTLGWPPAGRPPVG